MLLQSIFWIINIISLPTCAIEDLTNSGNKTLKKIQPHFQCEFEKVLISLDHGSKGYGEDVVREIYADPFSFTKVNLESQPFLCVDDRIEYPAIMTLGGDLGEFVMAFHIIRNFVPDINFTEEALNSLLRSYIQFIPNNRSFAYCTDTTVEFKLQRLTRIPNLKIVMTINANQTNPPEDRREELANLLTQPRFQGDIFMKDLLAKPKLYQISPDIAPTVIKSYYSLLWDKKDPIQKKLYLEVLETEHNPQAILEINTSDTCASQSTIPQVQPRLSRMNTMYSVFAIHKNACHSRRNQLIEFMYSWCKKEYPNKTNVAIEDIYKRLNQTADQWLQKAIKAMSTSLNYYHFTVY